MKIDGSGWSKLTVLMGVEIGQIVFVGRQVAVPRHHVQRRMIKRGGPERALELLDHLGGPVHILERGDGGEEVPHVGEAVGADRPELRQAKQGAIVLADVAARRLVKQFDPKLHAARDHAHLAGRQRQHAQLGEDRQATVLRHEQQLSVGVIEHPVDHRAIGKVEMHGDPLAHGHVAIAGDRDEPVQEVPGRITDLDRVPAEPVGVGGRLGKGAGADQPLRMGPIGGMPGARADAIEPASPVLVPRRGEGRARNLLCVETQRRALGANSGRWAGRPGPPRSKHGRQTP